MGCLIELTRIVSRIKQILQISTSELSSNIYLNICQLHSYLDIYNLINLSEFSDWDVVASINHIIKNDIKNISLQLL